MNPIRQIPKFLFAGLPIALLGQVAEAQFPKKNLNVVIFTADDLGPDGTGIGAFGAKIKGITPNIDKVANAAVRFYNAHVNSAICMPSRGVLGTGRYGFNSFHHGFFHAPDSVPTLMEGFQKEGYKTGILGKVFHSSVKNSTVWDYVYDYEDLGSGRSPSKYYEKTKAFVERCRKENRPFYFMINSHDPHRPFQEPDGKLLTGAEWPSRLYSPDEVFVPGFLPDLAGVRKEISHYYNSVRRLDDTFGKVMQAIKDAGVENNTVVIFLSDNGISMPFSKANCYLKSTKTVFFVYLPGTLKPLEDREHLISSVDLFPTIMDMIGAEKPAGLDGSSFLPLLEGRKQSEKNKVFTQIDYLSSNKYWPMRCVQDKEFGYIFNPWSDGKVAYHNANEGETFKAMEQEGKINPQIQARVDMFRYRTLEEFYNLKNDPDCLHNLIHDKAYTEKVQQYKNQLKVWMQKYHDPMLPVFNVSENHTEMRRMLDVVYSTTLKPGKNDSKDYAKKIEEMKMHNFE
ncbi:MAG TPA: sulfatase [Bacteroidales bacterium]|nr:sulfatase [Bacteroidales bacterium]